MAHQTPRLHQQPDDPAYFMLNRGIVTEQRVHRKKCYICEDREFARMGLPLCSPCCFCVSQGDIGHIRADGNQQCDDCKHLICERCMKLPPQGLICTCDTPCCEADIEVGVITCGSQHCPTHGSNND